MQRPTISLLVAAASLVGCSHTAPGTHVEVVDKEGAISYVGGAAGIGKNQSLACEQAVSRAVTAIAQMFGDKNDGIADDVAKEVGVEDGRIFMQRYAKASALDSAVHDVQFDPVEHVCMATVTWAPPVFVKEAILKYAEAIKRQELGGDAKPDPVVAPASAPAPAPAPVPAAAPPAASATAAPPPPPPDPCKSQRAGLIKAQKANQKVSDDFAECKRRTKGDEGICSRYKAYAEEGQAKEDSATKLLNGCLNANR